MFRPLAIAFLSSALLVCAPGMLLARCCPFCQGASQTFSEEIGSMDVVVIALLTELPPEPTPGKPATRGDEVPKAKFEIIQVLKGEALLKGKKVIETIYLGDAKPGKSFLIMGVDPPKVAFSSPLPISERGHKYLSQLGKLPKEGVARLEFFQTYLEDREEMLARDAYDEFARTPYEVVLALKDKMKHDQIVAWIEDPNVPASRRRLYLTLLGVCGGPSDLPLLEGMLNSEDRKAKAGLDAMIACYLTLKGSDGLPLIEDLYLKNKKAEYADTYSAIMALRFHGTETNIIPRPRLLQALHCILDRPQLADLVVPDLARWEDWAAMPRLVKLFKEADEKTSWVRVPVINYLRACPLPEAKDYIKELEKIDPEAVKRANTFFPSSPAVPAPVSPVPASPAPAAPASKVPAAPASKVPAAPAANSNSQIAPAGGKVEALPPGAVSTSAKGGGDIAAARYKAARNRAVASAGPKVEPDTSALPLPSYWLALGVPWLAGVALMLVQWTILRGRAGVV